MSKTTALVQPNLTLLFRDITPEEYGKFRAAIFDSTGRDWTIGSWSDPFAERDEAKKRANDLEAENATLNAALAARDALIRALVDGWPGIREVESSSGATRYVIGDEGARPACWYRRRSDAVSDDAGISSPGHSALLTQICGTRGPAPEVIQ